MGRKRNIKRHKNIIYAAGCLMFIWLLSGCQYNYYPRLSIENNKGINGKKHLDTARDLALGGDFDAAFAENAKSHDAFPAELKQVAIFQKALLHSHPDNPDQNYEKAMVCFELVDKDPDEVILEYNVPLIFSTLRGNCELAKDVTNGKNDIQKTRKLMEKSRKRVKVLLGEQKKLKAEIEKLRRQIEQLKEVDMNSNGKIQGVLSE